MGVGVRLHTNEQQREQAGWASKIRYQIKDFSIGCMGRCKPLGSRNSLLSYVPQLSGPNPVSLVTLSSGSCGRWLLLVFPQLLSSHRGGWRHLLDCDLGVRIHIWRPEILMAVTFLYWFGSRAFHFTIPIDWQYPVLLHALPPPVFGSYYSILYSMSLTVFHTSYKGIHVLVRLFLAYFSWHNVFQVRPCCLIGQDFLLFKKE